MRVRSIVRPPSARALPVTPWPPHRTETWRPWLRAALTALTTSSVVAQRAMTAGFLSTIAFQMARALPERQNVAGERLLELTHQAGRGRLVDNRLGHSPHLQIVK